MTAIITIPHIDPYLLHSNTALYSNFYAADTVVKNHAAIKLNFIYSYSRAEIMT